MAQKIIVVIKKYIRKKKAEKALKRENPKGGKK